MEHQNRLGSGLQIRKIKKVLSFPSLFSRLVSVYISILVVMLVILFVTFTNSFQAYVAKYPKALLIKQAQIIATEYSKAAHYSAVKEEALSAILPTVQIVNGYLDATTWIVDRYGNGYEIGESYFMNIGGSTDLKENLTEVFEGKVVEFEKGFKGNISTSLWSIGYPIIMNGQTQYAVFIQTQVSDILQTVDEVRNMILNVVGVIGSIVFIWIYIIAKQMTNPLKEMNQVAKNIASGEFDRRIEVKGNDEIAQLGSSLNHMAQALDKIEEDRRSFIANISHDLRSPLTSIQGFITAVLDGTIGPEHQERYLKIVLNESKRLINMTNAILELNQIQEGVKPIHKVQLNINEIINEAVISLEERRQEKNVSITRELDDMYFNVWGDREGIERVVQNLLDNALKFVNQDGNIVIRSRMRQDKLWISILNDGPSITPEQQKLIWERFYKADGSRGVDKKGVGLGLVIVKEIIKQHNEKIGVYSKEGKMVEFSFSMILAS